MNKKLALVLAFQAFLLLGVIRPNAMLWWDECTQVLLAKTVIQNPTQFHAHGLTGWHVESGKARLFPWLLALVGASQQAGIILNAILSLAVSLLLFKVVEKEFDDTTAFLSVLIMLSFVDPFLLYSVKLYNHMLAITLSLLSLYLMQNGRQTAGAVAFGMSMISRYDAWITAVPLVCLLIKNDAGWKMQAIRFFSISLAVASTQFIVSDILEFGAPFSSFIYERGVFLGISAVTEPLYYFWRFFSGNPVSAVFLVAGVLFSSKAGKSLFPLWLASALVYFEVLTPFKSLRYLITLLPVFSPLAAFGFTSLLAKMSGKRRRVVAVAMALFVAYNAFLAVSQKGIVTNDLSDDERLKDVVDFVGNKTVIVTNAFSPLACYSSAKIFILPPDEEQFQKLKFDYLLVLSESFKPDYLDDAAKRMEKVNYRNRTVNVNGTGYEYGTLDLYYVKGNPSG